MRLRGIRLVRIMDDVAIMADTMRDTLQHVLLLLQLTCKLGLMWGWRKCVLKPSATIQFYGCLWNAHTGAVFIPRSKILTIRKHVQELVEMEQCSAQQAASVQGKLRAYADALYGVKLLSRETHRFIVQTVRKKGWYTDAPLWQKVKVEL